ncbi:MAG: hypothetical protein ACKOMX_11615 [Actinomycetota bacterium]
MVSASAPNPMMAILRAIQSNEKLRDELWADPRGLISRLATRFPEEVLIDVFRDETGQAYMQASLSLTPEDYARSRARMRNCPVAQMSAEELVADPVGALAPYGIRVPEDVIVLSDGDYLHMRVPLDEV